MPVAFNPTDPADAQVADLHSTYAGPLFVGGFGVLESGFRPNKPGFGGQVAENSHFSTPTPALPLALTGQFFQYGSTTVLVEWHTATRLESWEKNRMDNRDILDTFAAMDRDSDGIISREEFFEHYENEGKAPQDIAALFDSLDMDGDGRIVRHEFLAAAAGGRI